MDFTQWSSHPHPHPHPHHHLLLLLLAVYCCPVCHLSGFQDERSHIYDFEYPTRFFGFALGLPHGNWSSFRLYFKGIYSKNGTEYLANTTVDYIMRP